LLESAGDAEPAGASFVGDLQAGAGVSFADAVQGLLQGVQVVGDGAKEPDLALGAGWGDGEGDGVFVDIETGVVFNGFHGVVVSSYSYDESERIPRLVRGRSYGSAHRATRDLNERQPHRRINPATHGQLWPVSHKV